MRNAVQRSIRISLFSLLMPAAFGAGAAFAQGSAGGSIGNDEKSLSGTREAPRSVENPARRSKPRPEAEEPRRAARKSGGGGGGGGPGSFDARGSSTQSAAAAPARVQWS
jgi:hypothetical protein